MKSKRFLAECIDGIETGMIGGSLKNTESGLHYRYREHERTSLNPPHLEFSVLYLSA